MSGASSTLKSDVSRTVRDSTGDSSGITASSHRLALEGIAARALDALNCREPLTLLELCHPSILIEPAAFILAQPTRPYLGRAGVLRYLADIQRRWMELTIETAQVRAAGQAVVALGYLSADGRDQQFEALPSTWMLKFGGESILRLQSFVEHPSLAAASNG